MYFFLYNFSSRVPEASTVQIDYIASLHYKIMYNRSYSLNRGPFYEAQFVSLVRNVEPMWTI